MPVLGRSLLHLCLLYLCLCRPLCLRLSLRLLHLLCLRLLKLLWCACASSASSVACLLSVPLPASSALWASASTFASASAHCKSPPSVFTSSKELINLALCLSRLYYPLETPL